MKTQIYKTYSDFLKRENKEENGVSEYFSTQHPDFEKENETNKRSWNLTGCSGCYDCFGCFGCSDCYDCFSCFGCSDCYDCFSCFGCSDCYDCFGCSDCSGCSDCLWKNEIKGSKENSPAFIVPIIENIHQKVYEATVYENALDMRAWHPNGVCGTTHCRGGWVEVLAGDEGKALAKATSTLFAAMMIYKASSPIRVFPPRFFESNEVAILDIKRCAEEEKVLQK